MKKQIIASILTLFLCFVLCASPALAAQSLTVRVGYYPFVGHQEVNQSGVRTGDEYDYYRELAQYTNWSYRFADTSYENCIKMLIDGEIDLMWGLPKNSATQKTLLLSELSTGSVAGGLYTTKRNSVLMYEDYKALDGLRVGVMNANLSDGQLDKLCKEQEIVLTKIFYPTQEELEDALQKGKVDIILAAHINDTSTVKMIAKLDEIPLYFATSKNNTDLMQQLNTALLKIKALNPFFETELNSKYPTATSSYQAAFTPEEQAYINQNPVVQVVYDAEWQPIEYKDAKTGEYRGITADVFKKIETYTGLKFAYTGSETFTQALQMLSGGKTEILASLTRDYDWADENGANLSPTFLKSTVVMVTRTAVSSEAKVVALPKSFCTTRQIKETQPEKTVIEYDTVEECLQAVKQGKADVTFLNANVANYFLATGAFSNLRIAGLTDYKENLAIAVSKQADPRLFSIINKALLQISSEEMNSIVLSNNVPERELSVADMFYVYPVECAVVIVLIAIVCIGLMAFLLKANNAKNKKIQEMLGEAHLNSERYQIALQQVSCDVFEYDVCTQTLFKSNKTDSGIKLGKEDNLQLVDNYSYGKLDEESCEKHRQMRHAVANGDKQVSGVLKSTLEDGSLCWKKLTLTSLKQGYVLSRVVITVEDVTSEYLAKMQYQTEQNYRNAMLSNAVAALTVNLTTQKIFSFYIQNQCVLDESDEKHYSPEMFPQLNIKIYPQDKEAMQEVFSTENLVNAYNFGYKQLDHTFRIWHKEKALWIKVTVNLLKAPETGDIMGFMYAQDVHEEEQQKRKLQSAARRDALTGLYNRATIEQMVTQALENKNESTMCAFFMLDVDNFKQVNDRYGHVNGDAALLCIAETLKRHFRAGDVIARMGGDEFAVFMKEVPNHNFLRQRAKAVLNDLRNNPLEQLQDKVLTISIGIAITQDNIAFDTLYSRADTALYITKQGGKNNFHICRENAYTQVEK
ncbi:MAG: diguanylate cyclase [Oscillospiraceae bacterium]|nr:diguanylate cyclase [Oscillospiraceae bacterium]